MHVIILIYLINEKNVTALRGFSAIWSFKDCVRKGRKRRKERKKAVEEDIFLYVDSNNVINKRRILKFVRCSESSLKFGRFKNRMLLSSINTIDFDPFF